MKHIVIKSLDECIWVQVGTKEFDSPDPTYEICSYIKEQPDFDNWYFEIVGKEFFDRFKKPYS